MGGHETVIDDISQRNNPQYITVSVTEYENNF